MVVDGVCIVCSAGFRVSLIGLSDYVQWTGYCADQPDDRTLLFNYAQSVVSLVVLIRLTL